MKWVDILSRNLYKWPTGRWKETQYYWLFEICKLEPQWGLTCPLLGCPTMRMKKVVSDVATGKWVFSSSGYVQYTERSLKFFKKK